MNPNQWDNKSIDSHCANFETLLDRIPNMCAANEHPEEQHHLQHVHKIHKIPQLNGIFDYRDDYTDQPWYSHQQEQLNVYLQPVRMR